MLKALRRCGTLASAPQGITAVGVGTIRRFRSRAALDTLRAMGESRRGGWSVVLYRYPCLSGALAALFAHLYHSRLRLPFLVLPFSSVAPFRVCDLKLDYVETCYLLGFFGPDDFAVQISQFIPRVIVFDHRQATMKSVSQPRFSRGNLELFVDIHKSSASAVYDYFSQKLLSHTGNQLLENCASLINSEDEARAENLLQYVEDMDLRIWNLPNIKAFNVGLREEHLNFNCITNPLLFEQLLKLNPQDLSVKGDLYTCSRQDTAKKMLLKSFKIRLGRGLYGECLGVRADGNSSLSHEIGDELSKQSEAAGLRPIGAVAFMKHGRMKVCLRSADRAVDTSEIAKAYGGGGRPSCSSFVIPMDEYNHWIHAISL